MTSTPKIYEFTAFQEDDLGIGNVCTGKTFTMPASATTCILATDNDGFLSGDTCYNEYANDGSYQTAEIKVDDTEIGNGHQIYAERIFTLKDQDGNTYKLIEIEQENSSEDYFTFLSDPDGSLTIPPAGTVLSIESVCNIGDYTADYNCLGAGDKDATSTISGNVFFDEDCDGLNEVTVECVMGENLIVNGDFEDNDLNNSGVDMNIYSSELPGWFVASGHRTADLFEQASSRHNTTATDAFIELDEGAIICQEVNIAEAGTYEFCFDLYENNCISSYNNRVKLLVNGGVHDIFAPNGQETFRL